MSKKYHASITRGRRKPKLQHMRLCPSCKKQAATLYFMPMTGNSSNPLCEFRCTECKFEFKERFGS